ncbi:MAG TPA: MoxR family ATPase [Candidatus Dormibacteraeota bacterium]|nr:MoxR family ATPase [Candidatus Dormibacteraeota bacterium]
MAQHVAQLAEQVRREMAKAIVGQREVVDQLLLVLLCGGHALLEGVPGLAKTLAVKTLAQIGQLQFGRVQCTPDLMPADVVGTNVFNMATSSFSLHRGPIFTDLLLVDEINRTPPRTQAALLESMEERQVTIDGTSHPLSRFFTVLATQNPIEFEGTYPLPEAQLDRFLMKIRVAYPSAAEESQILEHYHQGFDAKQVSRIVFESLPVGWLDTAREELRLVRVEPHLFNYVSTIARRSREWPSLSLGASPRAALALLFVAKGTAALEGRDFLIPDDVKAIAPAVLRHRLLLKPEADLDGITADQVVAEIVAAVEVPK